MCKIKRTDFGFRWKEEKARIQTKSAEIARNYRKQQEMQSSNQPLQHQEDIKE